MNVVDTSKCHFFYGGNFSQWATSPFVYHDLSFNRAEQFMMFGKAVMFNDFGMATRIMDAKDPQDQKSLGRAVKGFDKEQWEEHAYNIVLLGNLLKFTQNTDMQSTFDDSELFVEASPTDMIWGIGRAMSDDKRFEYLEWRGQNLLGQVITEIRDFLIGKPDPDFFANLDLAREVLKLD